MRVKYIGMVWAVTTTRNSFAHKDYIRRWVNNSEIIWLFCPLTSKATNCPSVNNYLLIDYGQILSALRYLVRFYPDIIFCRKASLKTRVYWRNTMRSMLYQFQWGRSGFLKFSLVIRAASSSLFLHRHYFFQQSITQNQGLLKKY